tara:strand:+ start:21871 stop:22128 length:258 start_codon:yes stop_codon:yes gene_type:complete
MTKDEKIKKLQHAFTETIWMAMRYANGRPTYAPSMVRDAIKEFQEVFPDWKPKADPTLKYVKESGYVAPAGLDSDWLDDLVEESR